jgi:hypothetical protein
MSIIPEIIIQRALVDGIRKIRGSSWKSDQLFKSAPQDYAQQFFKLIQNTPIDITMNYPREDSQFPCVCILLRAEEETDILLGDLLSTGYDVTSGLLGSNEFFYTEGDTSTTFSSYDSMESVGEPPRLFDRKERIYKEVRGSGFSCSYLLQVMTDDQNFTVFLYHLIRYIVLSNISVFSTNGMHQLRLSGTDFLPQASQQPNFIFMRGINMNFLYFADHFVVEGDDDIEAIAKSFVIDMGLASKKDFGILTEVQNPNIETFSPTGGTQGATIAWTYDSAGDVLTTGMFISGINFQASTGNYDFLTISNVNKEAGYLELDPSSDPIKYLHIAGEMIIGGGGKSFLTEPLRPGDSVIHVNDVTVFTEFETLGTTEFFAAIGSGLTIDFVSSDGVRGSTGYIKSDNIDISGSEDKIIFFGSQEGTYLSTDITYVYPDNISESISPGMFLQVSGPSTHPAYHEQRRIISFTPDTETSITVANKFSGSLDGAIVKILKRYSTIKFDVTISSTAPTGVWDVVVTNPDLITTTLKNSFTVT